MSPRRAGRRASGTRSWYAGAAVATYLSWWAKDKPGTGLPGSPKFSLTNAIQRDPEDNCSLPPLLHTFDSLSTAQDATSNPLQAPPAAAPPAKPAHPLPPTRRASSPLLDPLPRRLLNLLLPSPNSSERDQDRAPLLRSRPPRSVPLCPTPQPSSPIPRPLSNFVRPVPVLHDLHDVPQYRCSPHPYAPPRRSSIRFDLVLPARFDVV